MGEPGKVYTIEHLRNWDGTVQGIQPMPRYAVIGNAVEQSLWPLLHQAGFQALGLPESCVRIQVGSEELAEAVQLFKQHRFRGVNVTPPQPAAVAACLDEVSEPARHSGAVNTILFEEGRATGFNTDGLAFRQAIRDEFFVDLSDLRILILGASSATGRALALQCAEDRCERLVLVDRDLSRIQDLADQVRDPLTRGRFVGPVVRFEAIPWEEEGLAFALRQIDLIVNGTDVGRRRSDPRLLSPALIQPHHLVYDPIYQPPRTRFLEDGITEGARVANGLSLVLWQCAIAMEYWLNSDPPVEAMRLALKSATC